MKSSTCGCYLPCYLPYKPSGKAVYADLEDEEGNKSMTWLPSCPCIDLKDYGWKTRTVFIRLLGLKQSEKNPDRQYFDYDIMWAACEGSPFYNTLIAL